MAYINFKDRVEALKKNVPMHVVIDHFTELKQRKNGKYICICPFHNDTKPSMHISDSFCKCFACGWGGDIFKFVQEIIYQKERTKVSFPDAMRIIEAIPAVQECIAKASV